MVDIIEVSAVVTAVGVLIGVVYYLLEIRHQTQIRETDLEIRTNPVFNLNGIEWVQAMRKITVLEYKDYDDFVKKYGGIYNETPITVGIATMSNFYEAIGYLLKRNLISVDYVWDCYGEVVISVWEKLKPIIEGHRKQYNLPGLWKPFEYLYSEMKKREQQLASKKA